MIVGGERGDGGVIGQAVGVVVNGGTGVGVPGPGDAAAAAQGGLPDDQHAAGRLQHDHLPHLRRSFYLHLSHAERDRESGKIIEPSPRRRRRRR